LYLGIKVYGMVLLLFIIIYNLILYVLLSFIKFLMFYNKNVYINQYEWWLLYSCRVWVWKKV